MTMYLNDLMVILLGLSGFGAFVSALINLLKTLGWVEDGSAPRWVAGLNLLGLVGLYALDAFGLTLNMARADQTLGLLAQILVATGQLLVLMGGSRLFYGLVRGTPVIGKSFSV